MKTLNQTAIIARFIAKGMLSLNVLNDISLAPTKSWVRGDPIGKSILKQQEDGWYLESPLNQEAELHDHVAYLLNIFSPKIDFFINKNIKIKIFVALYIHGDDRPAIQIGPDLLSQMAKFDATFDIDLYVLPAD